MTEEKEKIIKLFLIKLGGKIRYKRKAKGLKQEALASYLEVNDSSISRYEAGDVDFPVSKLALISKYCDTPLKEYFDEELQKSISLSLCEMTKLIQEKYQKKDARKAYHDKKMEQTQELLVGYIYEKDGKRYMKERRISELQRTTTVSVYEKCIRGDYYTDIAAAPFDEKELMQYFEQNPKLLKILECSRQMMECMGDRKDLGRLKTGISEYAIREVFIEKMIKHESWDALRAYAYYKRMLEKL